MTIFGLSQMKTATVAHAKSHLSALIAEVGAGDEVVITRRGKPVARLVAEMPLEGFGWADLARWVSAPPVTGMTVAQMREQDLL